MSLWRTNSEGPGSAGGREDGAEILSTLVERVVPPGGGVEMRRRADLPCSRRRRRGRAVGRRSPGGRRSPAPVPSFEQVTYFAWTRRRSPDDDRLDGGPVLTPYLVPDPEEPGRSRWPCTCRGLRRPGRRSFDPDPVRSRRLRLTSGVVRASPTDGATDTCLYTNTPDEDFVLDRDGPIVIGSPCSGHGFKFTPLIGEFLADLATGDRGPIPLERFASTRPTIAGSATR